MGDLREDGACSGSQGGERVKRSEAIVKLQEAAELVSCHLGDSDHEWEIKDSPYANKPDELVLIFKIDIEEGSE